MFKQPPELQAVSIVLLGDFNPRIFQPYWFAEEKIISTEERDTAAIEVIHADAVIFALPWLNFQVTREQLLAASSEEPYERLHNFVLQTLRLLRHTPVRAVGVNLNVHFRLESEEKWHQVGDALAPKGCWEDILERPGMRSLVMQESKLSEDFLRQRNVKIEPSLKMPKGVYGIYAQVNNHFQVRRDEEMAGCRDIIGILEAEGPELFALSMQLVQSLLAKVP